MTKTFNQAIYLKPALLFTRRVYALTVDILLPFRLAWTPMTNGFAITLSVLRESGTPDPLVVNLVALPCAFGGQRYYFRCPACGRRRVILYWNDDRLLCQSCAQLRYASVTWASDERLEAHYQRRQRALDAGLGRISARAARFGMRAEIHAARYFRRCVRGLRSLETRPRAREGRQPGNCFVRESVQARSLI